MGKYKIKKIMTLSLVTASILFSGCDSEDKNDKVITSNNVPSVFNEKKPDISKGPIKDEVKNSTIIKKELPSDFDKVKDSASAFGSAVGGYFSKKYSEASEASKVLYEDTKVYSKVKYDDAQKYYYEVSGQKAEKEKLEKKIKKIESDLQKKEAQKKKIFGNQLTKDKKDNLDFEEKEVIKKKTKLEKLKEELNKMTADIKKSQDDFNKINRPQKQIKKKKVE